jgi:hypothetical protein
VWDILLSIQKTSAVQSGKKDIDDIYFYLADVKREN